MVGPDLLANIAGFTPTTRAGRMAPLLAKIQQAPVREPHRHRHRAGQPGAVVRDGDDVYVRSVNGRGSSWFRGTQHRHEARIRAGGVEKDVSLVETDAANDEVEAAYHANYDRPYPSIVPRIVATDARAATLKLIPR